jgi:hypothetical protein
LLETVLPMRYMQRLYQEGFWPQAVVVETSSNTPTVALRVVGGKEKGTQCLGDINTGILPSRLRVSRIWDSKIWPRVLRVSDPKMTALARASSNCPLVREGAPNQQTRNCQTIIKIWS